jgi:Carboxypeptidase regulatory-like domain
MKQVFRSLALAAVFALLAGSQAPPPKTYRISGVVVDRAANRPLPRVRIVMNPAGDESKHSEATTGADGQFAFEKVTAGMWSLYTERKGFSPSGLR